LTGSRRCSALRLLDRIAAITPGAFLTVQLTERVPGFIPLAGNRAERFP